MKKVLLMNVLYKPNIGGVENSLSEIASVLKDNDYLVDIVCSDRNNNTTEKLSLFEKGHNYNIYRYEYSFERLSFIHNTLRSARLLIQINKKKDYSYIISRSYFLVIIGSLVGIKNIKYIAPEVTLFSIKGSKNKLPLRSQSLKYFKTILQTLSFIIAKEVFVFSDSMLHQVRKNTFNIANPIKVEPGINLERFSIPTLEEKQILRSQLDIPSNKKVILCLGRFSELKQFEIAINSMTLLPNDYLLLIVGSGPEKEYYEKLIFNNNLRSSVKILDSTTQPEKFYKLSNAFLMTSRYESFGQTVLEAYASGLKVIAFNQKSGVNTNVEKMLINCSNVYYVGLQSAKELAKVILEAFCDKTKVKSEARKTEVLILKERYSWCNFVKNIGIPFK